MASNFSTGIIQYPSGTFGFAGSIPIELTHEVRSGYGIIRTSNIYRTEEGAIRALLAVGCRHFQLSDCSWYKDNTNNLPEGTATLGLTTDRITGKNQGSGMLEPLTKEEHKRRHHTK